MGFASRPILILAVALCGCASTPQMTVTSTGHLPSSGSFSVAEEEAGCGSACDVAARRLEKRGLSQEAGGTYLLQVADGARPGRTGLLVPEQMPGAWFRSPAKQSAKRSVRTLIVSLSERSTGNEIYRGEVSVRSRTEVAADTLVDAALMGAQPPS